MRTRIIKFIYTYPNLFSFLVFSFWIILAGILNSIFVNFFKDYIVVFIILSYLIWVALTMVYSKIYGKSKYWSLLGFLGWLIVVGFRKDDSKIDNIENRKKSSSIQFLAIFSIIGFSIYGMSGKNIGWILSLLVLIFIIWYTKKK